MKKQWQFQNRRPSMPVLLLLVLALTGCGQSDMVKNLFKIQTTPVKGAEVLRDLAYDNGQASDWRIYIEEDGKMTPYLVLTSQYNGNCLLLREYLMDEPRIYNEAKLYSAYYEDSEIDKYLNGEFLALFSDKVQDLMETSAVVITAKESLEVGGETTKIIDRKVFLLSLTEVGHRSRIYAVEGEPLHYFPDMISRIAYHEDGEPESWWLRTPSTASHDVVSCVTSRGGEGDIGIQTLSGISDIAVRPAFCMKGDLSVTREGETYVLAELRHETKDKIGGVYK